MTIYERVLDALGDCSIPVTWLDNKSKPNTYGIFFEVGNSYKQYADNEPRVSIHYIQLSIFTKEPWIINSKLNEIKRLLEGNGFIVGNDGPDIFELDSQILQKVINFRYEEEL